MHHCIVITEHNYYHLFSTQGRDDLKNVLCLERFFFLVVYTYFKFFKDDQIGNLSFVIKQKNSKGKQIKCSHVVKLDCW